jgi:3-isopropylmalate/(R)-2-methylmalate dehydratase small subunit
MMQTRFQGRVWVFGDDISTDHIISGKYLGAADPKALGEHAMEAVDPQFSKSAKAGDIVVAASNFGCGSSREQAVWALQGLGVSCVVANTFARIFYRNAINVGFPVIECLGLHGRVKSGDVISVDLEAGTVALASGEAIPFQPIPPNLLEILQAGGLVPKLKRELAPRRD